MDGYRSHRDPAWDAIRAASARAWDEKIKRLGAEALPNPQVIVERGKRIYEERYKADYEREHHGKFVAIDIETEKAYVGSTPNEAFSQGLQASPTACLFLIKAGSRTAWELKGGYRHACSCRSD
jgi:hypothetical protein